MKKLDVFEMGKIQGGIGLVKTALRFLYFVTVDIFTEGNQEYGERIYSKGSPGGHK